MGRSRTSEMKSDSSWNKCIVHVVCEQRSSPPNHITSQRAARFHHSKSPYSSNKSQSIRESRHSNLAGSCDNWEGWYSPTEVRKMLDLHILNSRSENALFVGQNASKCETDVSSTAQATAGRRERNGSPHLQNGVTLWSARGVVHACVEFFYEAITFLKILPHCRSACECSLKVV